MANADSRKFGVRFEGVDNGLLLGFQQPGPDTILYVANNTETNGGSIPNTNLANVKWYNGVDEERFNGGKVIAYTVVNGAGVPQLITTEGIQTEVPPQGSPLAISSENDAYIRFKSVADNAEFEEAIYQIIALNEAAGASFNDPNPIQGSATTAQVKTWADANLNYWTNFETQEVTTTVAPTTYSGVKWQLLNDGSEAPITYRYYPLQQDDISNPTAAGADSPVGIGQTLEICSLDPETPGLNGFDVTPFPFPENQVGLSATILTFEGSPISCNYNDTSGS